jgi:hypothetical protein
MVLLVRKLLSLLVTLLAAQLRRHQQRAGEVQQLSALTPPR